LIAFPLDLQVDGNVLPSGVGFQAGRSQ